MNILKNLYTFWQDKGESFLATGKGGSLIVWDGSNMQLALKNSEGYDN
jgi:hypothetical protein